MVSAVWLVLGAPAAILAAGGAMIRLWLLLIPSVAFADVAPPDGGGCGCDAGGGASVLAVLAAAASLARRRAR